MSYPHMMSIYIYFSSLFTVEESSGEPPILCLVEDFTDTIQEVESADDSQGNSNYTVGRL